MLLVLENLHGEVLSIPIAQSFCLFETLLYVSLSATSLLNLLLSQSHGMSQLDYGLLSILMGLLVLIHLRQDGADVEDCTC